MSQGYLQVWHGFFSRWVKYYFRVHEDTLIFGPKREEVQGKVHLKVAEIISIVDDPISFIVHTGTDTLRLRASSIDERVKWFKRLKKIKTNIQQQNYTKDRTSYNSERNRSTKLKMLQSIVLDICLNQAELENVTADISSKPKNGMDKLIEKLRKYAQIIKQKAMEAHKIAKEIVRTERDRPGGSSARGMYTSPGPNYYDEDQYSDIQQHDGTAYMSFEDQREQKLFKVFSKKDSKYQDLKQISKLSPPLQSKRSLAVQNSIVSPFKVASSNNLNRMGSSNRNIVTFQNPIKQRLLDDNPGFVQFKRTLGSNKIRTALPEKFTPEQKFPIGSVVKGSLGADLTKFALPVVVNQPISMLQKSCQQLYYSKLLDQANEIQSPQKRMLYVAAFLVSQYSLSDHRIRKPFNPLLGETFQFYDTTRQFTCLCEQVSHHPPISALYCHSSAYEIFDQAQAKTSFTGTSIKVLFQGKSKIKLQKYGDQYIYNKCSVNLNNLLMGKTQIQITGDLTIQCKKYDTSAKIQFKQQGFFQRNGANEIQGQITIKGNKCYTISGKWNQDVKAVDVRDRTPITVWTRTHVNNKDYYYFNDYTMLLNHLNKEILAEVAPTDSRLRPDQRAMEYRSRIHVSESEKSRLQQKQRLKRKQNEQKKIQHKIKWFQLRKDADGNQFYINNNNYDVDYAQEWADYPDIF